MLLLAVVLGLAGGPTAHGADGSSADEVDENDPIEPVNRATFEFNRIFLRYTARPLAIAYRTVVPELVRDGFRNLLDNLNSPLRIGNDLLQGDPEAAARDTARFVVNTTAGIGGVIDVARHFDIPHRENDLGLTMGRYGVGEGPYVVVPVLGPSNPRDATGNFAQGFADPFNLWVQDTDYALYALIGRLILGNVDLYARHMDELDRIEASSIDFYASLRSLHRDKRRTELRRIGVGVESPPSTGIDYGVDLDAGTDGAAEESAPVESPAPVPTPAP